MSIIEDELFDLMTKMYSDMNKRFDVLENKVGIVDDKIDNTTKELKSLSNHVTALEHDLKNDIKALYDGYKQTYEKVVAVENKLEKDVVCP